ncbi:hypothetical protein ACFC1L_39930 [Streptomyces sp. NPDC056210]|uniref:hypothetical protein n=1 Tax=Streptomyces sp. NPDC056210 TaxID=3345746 RepID=UPI0035E16057
MATIKLDIVEPGKALGFLTEDAGDWSIYGTKEGNAWHLWTDDHGEARGSTLDVAVKRWAIQYGIAHGTAELDNEKSGRKWSVQW